MGAEIEVAQGRKAAKARAHTHTHTHTPAKTCHSRDCVHTPCSLGPCRAFHQLELTSYPFNTSGKKIALSSPSADCCLVSDPHQMVQVCHNFHHSHLRRSPRICHGNTLQEDLAVFVLRARHDWSGILLLTRSPFPFCHHGILAFCSKNAKT